MIKYIIAALALGVAAGYLNNNFLNAFPNALVGDQLFNLSLIVILFVFGLSFGIDKDAMHKVRRAGPRILAFPFFVVLGSLVGGLISALILGINVVGTIAVSTGCGWYTLSGPLIGQLFGAELGTLSFAANFFRELLTITMIYDVLITAFSNGLILTLIVPFTIFAISSLAI